MSGGGGTTTNTSTSSSDPWSGAQPLLNSTMGKAKTYLDNGTGAGVYTDSTVTPMDSRTTQGYDAMTSTANDNLNGQGTSGQYQDIINNGGYNSAQQTAMGNLMETATNPLDVTQNDAYQRLRTNSMKDARDMSNLSAAASGRYGSGGHQDVLTGSIMDAASGMDMQALQQMTARQDAATQGLFNAGQQAQGNLSTAYQGMQMPADQLLQAGSAYEDLASREIADKTRIFDAQQNSGWDQLAKANAIANGASGFGTSSNTQTQPSQNNGMSDALGLAMGAGSMFF